MKLRAKLRLLSDATFGRGDGVAGIIDTEIEQEPRTGLPCIKGRTLRGLIVEECANLLAAIRAQQADELPNEVLAAAVGLFGRPGSTDAETGKLHVGHAHFPDDLRTAIRKARLTADTVLEMTTCVRRQTAMDEETDAPLNNSLRSQRALLRETCLVADLSFVAEPVGLELPLLAAAVRCVRRGGIGRNRGRGEIEARLFDDQDREVSVQPLFDFLASKQTTRPMEEPVPGGEGTL